MCYLPRLLIGLLIVIGTAAAIRWNLRQGRIWADSLGFMTRRDNPLGFWSAVVLHVLLCIAMLGFIWLEVVRSCSATPLAVFIVHHGRA